MKKSTVFTSLGILVLSGFLILAGCKKDSDSPVTPAFDVTYSTVNLQGGGQGLQFYARCTNNAVTMEHITISDPASAIVVQEYNGASFAKNELFPMQETNSAFVKSTGTWKFNIVGSRTADGAAFAVDATLAVSK